MAWAAARVRPPSLLQKETGQNNADTQIPMKWGIGPSIGDGFCPTILATGATARYTRGAFRPMTRGLLALLVPTGGTMTRTLKPMPCWNLEIENADKVAKWLLWVFFKTDWTG